MIVGTAGHIDHGKTALIKALTGVDADRLKEEKARGITIDLGYAYAPLPDGTVVTDFVYQVDSLAAGKRPKLTLDQASKLNSHAEGIMTGIGCN